MVIPAASESTVTTPMVHRVYFAVLVSSINEKPLFLGFLNLR